MGGWVDGKVVDGRDGLVGRRVDGGGWVNWRSMLIGRWVDGRVG